MKTQRTRRPRLDFENQVATDIRDNSSEDFPLIYQKKPAYSKPRYQNKKPKGWTDSIESYCIEADRLTQCLLNNKILAKKPYTWFVTIKVHKTLSPIEIKEFWNSATGKFKRKGVVALWIREATRNNRIHYHLLFRSEHSEKELTSIVEYSMPPRSITRWSKSVERVKDCDYRLFQYLGKSKVAFGGNPDIYAKKRLLLVPKKGIYKLGQIGGFWLKSRKAIYKEKSKVEGRICLGSEQEYVRDLIQHVHTVFFPDRPIEKIARPIAYYWDSEYVQDWISKLFRNPTPTIG